MMPEDAEGSGGLTARLHVSGEKRLLAVADRKILGCRFSERGAVLDVPPAFYSGTDLTREEIIVLMRQTEMVNLVGNECVSLALELGLLEPACVLVVEGTSYAQIMRF